MAEFCLECFNKLEKTEYKKRHVVLDYDFCEGCGEWKKCVVIVKRKPLTKIGIIVSVCLLIGLAAVLLIPYFISLSGAKHTESNEHYDYVMRYAESKSEITEATGFSTWYLEEKGFQLSGSDIELYALKDAPGKICYIKTLFTDFETYYITLTIYLADAPEERKFTDTTCSQITISNRAVDLYTNHKTNENIARYVDSTKHCYYIEPSAGIFNSTENNFLACLIISLKRY